MRNNAKEKHSVLLMFIAIWIRIVCIVRDMNMPLYFTCLLVWKDKEVIYFLTNIKIINLAMRLQENVTL
jgi:hypothetical protein